MREQREYQKVSTESGNGYLSLPTLLYEFPLSLSGFPLLQLLTRVLNE